MKSMILLKQGKFRKGESSNIDVVLFKRDLWKSSLEI